MKVRLKPADGATANYAAKFQFHEGPIKTTDRNLFLRFKHVSIPWRSD